LSQGIILTQNIYPRNLIAIIESKGEICEKNMNTTTRSKTGNIIIEEKNKVKRQLARSLQ